MTALLDMLPHFQMVKISEAQRLPPLSFGSVRQLLTKVFRGLLYVIAMRIRCQILIYCPSLAYINSYKPEIYLIRLKR